MSSDRELRATGPALADYRSLLRYSFNVWGVERQIAYSRRLRRALTDLVTFPEMGTKRDDLDAGLRSLPVGQHFILYRIKPDAIVVVRIVDQRMNLSEADVKE